MFTLYKAPLDFIGLPVHVPGNLECRFQLGTFRDDGTWIDDGSRSGPKQSEKHRLVIEPRQSVAKRVGESFTWHSLAPVPFTKWQSLANRVRTFLRLEPLVQRWQVIEHIGPLARAGYAPPDLTIIEAIAAHEHDEAILAARKARLVVTEPTLRLVVSAIGFDIEGRGEMMIRLAKATVRPDGTATITEKADGILLRPYDHLRTVIVAIDDLAGRIGYEPLCDEDVSLIGHVAHTLWTPETVNRRVAQASEIAALNGITQNEVRQIQFAEQLSIIGSFNPIPVGTPTPEPMRIIN